VIAIIPTADRSKATVKVRVAFKRRDERILPEMGARVSFLQDAALPLRQHRRAALSLSRLTRSRRTAPAARCLCCRMAKLKSAP